jgi:uncharacterized protein
MLRTISIFTLFFLVLFSPGNAELPLQKKPPHIELRDRCGGRLDGRPWSSSEINGKVFSVYYIDPDEADLNEPLFAALKAERFPNDKVRSIAIINMKATWMPGGVLSMMLERKQKRYHHTLYVKDNCKTLASLWQLADHSSDILLFDTRGEVIFSNDGKLSDTQIRKVVDLVWKTIGGKPTDAQK